MARKQLGPAPTGDTDAVRKQDVVGRGDLVHNVLDYGAVGDGVADDTAEIHLARDAAGVGGRVFFPAGTYLVGPLAANVADQTWELAPGAELIYNGASDQDLITVSAENFSIHGGTLDISSITFVDTWVTSGIRVDADGVDIRGVTINNAPTNAIWINEVNRATVVGCTFNEFIRSAVRVHNLEPNLHIYDFLIADNVMESSTTGSGGVNLYCYDSTMAIERARICHNTITIPPYVSGTAFEALTVFAGVDCVIDGNVISGSWSPISTWNLTRSAISNNTVRKFGRIGVEISGEAVSDVAITGNVIDVDGQGVTGTSGIETSAGTVDRVTITGNVIKGFNLSGVGVNLSSGDGVDGMVIAGNIIAAQVASGSFSAISTNQDVTNLTVTGNVIDCGSTASSYGLNFASGAHTGVTVTGNSFSNIAVRAANLSSAGGGTYTDVRFTGNMIRNCGDGLGGSGFAGAVNIVQDSAAATAGTMALRDSNANLVANAFVPSLTSTATAAGTTPLTVGSSETQLFTGSTTQTVALPTTSVVAGQRFTIVNSSTAVVTVTASGGSTVTKLAAGASGVFVALQAVPTTAAHWSYDLSVIAASSVRDTNGNVALSLSATASAANYAKIVNAVSGDRVEFTVDGSDSNISMFLRGKGSTGEVQMLDSASKYVAKFTNVGRSNCVNYLEFSGHTTGQSPQIKAYGTDANVSLAVITQGTGTLLVNGVSTSLNSTTSTHTAQQIELGHASDTTISRTAAGMVAVEGNPVGVKVAVPASATATGVVGQWAADSSWIYVCTAANTWVRAALASW